MQCASGSIHSPALLLRSGINNSAIGANLRLHPVTCVFANMRDPVDIHLGQPTGNHSGALTLMAAGAPMTTVSNEIVGGTRGDYYGAKVTTTIPQSVQLLSRVH